MDISDILKGLNARHLDRDPFADDGDDFADGRPSGQADLQALTRAWINERGAVELIPYTPSPQLSSHPNPSFLTDGPKTAS